jgi:hypothetical protein
MESHYFSEPFPVEPQGKDALPTWRVEVMRLSVTDAPVATLLVSNENLPPRRRKNKVLWKLPDNALTNPTFGEHEKKRLWELFKLQKKERRKKSLLEKDNAEEEDDTQSTGEDPLANDATATPTTTPTSQTNANTTPVQPEGEQFPPLTPAQPPRPPPPGFGQAAGPPRPSPPPPGLSAAPTATAAGPPRTPPPGLSATTTATATAPLSKPASNNLSTSASPSTYPAGAVSSFLSSPPPPQQQPSLFGPPRYFRQAPHAPVTALAAQVAQCFLHTMQSATPGIPKTLLIGRAQAICRTPQDCLQQVRSLSVPGESTWECHGYTIQPTLTGSTTNVADQSPSYLIILTGRTIQKGESLAYNLTLVLLPVPVVPPTAAEAADSGGAVYYQIQNDVLSLFAVNVNVAASAPV